MFYPCFSCFGCSVPPRKGLTLLTGNAGASIPLRVGMLVVVELQSPTSLLGDLVFARAP